MCSDIAEIFRNIKQLIERLSPLFNQESTPQEFGQLKFADTTEDELGILLVQQDFGKFLSQK